VFSWNHSPLRVSIMPSSCPYIWGEMWAQMMQEVDRFHCPFLIPLSLDLSGHGGSLEGHTIALRLFLKAIFLGKTFQWFASYSRPSTQDYDVSLAAIGKYKVDIRPSVLYTRCFLRDSTMPKTKERAERLRRHFAG
jgi:hypothetical protein